MSTSLHSSDSTEAEVEPIGHDYRLRKSQFRQAMKAGIIPETDRVELIDGFLVQDGSHYPLSLAQYRAMAEAHILTTDDRIELLEGWLVAKLRKSPRHSVSKGLTDEVLRKLLPTGWYPAIGNPLNAIDSEPEPDISILRGAIRDYRDHWPGPGDVALIVEVADSSLSRDRTIKKRLYARAGFPIYWLINLIDNQIEVYTEPTGPVERPDYLQRRDFGRDDMIPVVIEGQEIGRIAVRDLLP